jgi:peptidyl-dipeptidase A
MMRLTIVLASLALPFLMAAATQPTVAEAKAFMDKAEAEILKMTAIQQRAGWVQETYITDDTELLAADQNEKAIARTTELIEQSKRFDSLKLPDDLRRKFLLLKLSLTMPAPKNAKLREELTQIAASLDGSYGKGKYCPGGEKEPCFGIDDLEEKLAKSRDPKELEAMWTGWHKIGVPMRDRYARFVELSNQGARELGFADTGVLWRAGYDMTPEQYSAELERVWSEVEPLYAELHTYVRKKLIARYGTAAQRGDGMIPAHLVGNMWAQEWGNIYDVVAPPTGPLPYDLGAILKARNTDGPQLVRYGEGFYKSLGFDALPDTFWKRSMLAHPRDRDVVCHPSAWDLDGQRDVRIKACFQPTADDFVTVHHELGHNFYQRAYNKQAFLFRNGANDGFHEAIGDAIALSITPAYLKTLGLAPTEPPAEADIPLQLRTALDKVAFLPFALALDKWRWEVFSGEIKPADYNSGWWELRAKYQGVAPPVERTEADFDPGAKNHIPTNVPYARYFLARIYQFQFYKAMCDASGYKGPLNRCSFYGSKAAGDKLKEMLEAGQSQPWQQTLKEMTGSDHLDAQAMLDYFAPLYAWLKEQNKAGAPH